MIGAFGRSWTRGHVVSGSPRSANRAATWRAGACSGFPARRRRQPGNLPLAPAHPRQRRARAAPRPGQCRSRRQPGRHSTNASLNDGLMPWGRPSLLRGKRLKGSSTSSEGSQPAGLAVGMAAPGPRSNRVLPSGDEGDLNLNPYPAAPVQAHRNRSNRELTCGSSVIVCRRLTAVRTLVCRGFVLDDHGEASRCGVSLRRSTLMHQEVP